MKLPRFAPSAADAVESRDHARAILNAYYAPEITHAGDPNIAPGRQVRIAGDVHIVVHDDTIISVGRYAPERPAGASPVFGPVDGPKHRRRGKGGCGTRIPTTITELIERIEAAGGTVDRSQRHYVVSVPGARKRVAVPRNLKDWRSIRNSVAELRRCGLDVGRDAC